MSPPFIARPVLWHSARTGSKYNPDLTEEQRQMLVAKWLSWYAADWSYARTTVIAFSAAVLFGLLLNVISRLRTRKRNVPHSSPGILDRITASLRYTTSKQYRFRLTGYYSPPLSALIIVGALFVFIFALMLGPRPYYWPNMAMGHSQPLATRSGYLALGIMPFMIASASKVNYIATLVGTSHEKVQVFHRWSAFVMYVAGLVHTFPFIVDGIEMGTMRKSWNTSPYYWSGVAALVPQTYLVFFSWGIFRNKYYETFKKLHFLFAAVFMVAFFIHCNFRLSSWDYFWATLAIYSTSWLYRTFRTLYNSGFTALPASIQYLPSSESPYIKVTIPVSTRVKWRPGQHVFVRFMDLGLGPVHWFSSHPFTVVSLPRDGNVELVLKVHGGITAALVRKVSNGKTVAQTRVFVDGPYGGIPVDLKGYDRVMLLAGGSGSTTIIPVLNDLVAESSGKKIDFVVAVRERDAYTWMEEDLSKAVSNSAEIALRIHITGNSEALSSKQSLGISDEISSNDEDIKQSTSLSSHEVNGRPNLPAIIHKACKETHKGRFAIIACGPESFLYDVRNTVAGCQVDILDGFGCKEVFLHTENYSW